MQMRLHVTEIRPSLYTTFEFQSMACRISRCSHVSCRQVSRVVHYADSTPYGLACMCYYALASGSAGKRSSSSISSMYSRHRRHKLSFNRSRNNGTDIRHLQTFSRTFSAHV